MFVSKAMENLKNQRIREGRFMQQYFMQQVGSRERVKGASGN